MLMKIIILSSIKINLDLNTIEPSLAGPKRPQDKILLKDIPKEFKKVDKTSIVIQSKTFVW